MIVVEGPDGSGKTTLIESLGLERRRLKSLRGGVGGVNTQGQGDGTAGWSTGRTALAEYTRLIHAHAKCPFAFDRFHLSEHVYGPILRNSQQVDYDDLDLIGATLRAHHVKVILCMPPFATTHANVARQGRERPTYQTDEFLRQAYLGFRRLEPWATVVYDFTRHPIPTI